MIRPIDVRSRRTPGFLRSSLLLVVTTLLLAIGFTPAALAASAPAGAPTPGTAPATAPTVPVMVVLDASGSMNQSDAPGPRIDAAKSAVNSLIDSLPADTQVGLQVYGTGTGSTDAEKAAGCTDIKTLAPVGPLDATALKAQVATVIASGYTPIGNALRAAADALPNEGPRSIVLVSDGEDTCAPPAPCDVAERAAPAGHRPGHPHRRVQGRRHGPGPVVLHRPGHRRHLQRRRRRRPRSPRHWPPRSTTPSPATPLPAPRSPAPTSPPSSTAADPRPVRRHLRRGRLGRGRCHRDREVLRHHGERRCPSVHLGDHRAAGPERRQRRTVRS